MVSGISGVSGYGQTDQPNQILNLLIKYLEDPTTHNLNALQDALQKIANNSKFPEKIRNEAANLLNYLPEYIGMSQEIQMLQDELAQGNLTPDQIAKIQANIQSMQATQQSLVMQMKSSAAQLP